MAIMYMLYPHTDKTVSVQSVFTMNPLSSTHSLVSTNPHKCTSLFWKRCFPARVGYAKCHHSNEAGCMLSCGGMYFCDCVLFSQSVCSRVRRLRDKEDESSSL